MTPQTTCSLAEHWIYSSLDGELSESLESQLERHLDACPACRDRMAEAQAEQYLLAQELSGLGGEFEVLLEDRLTADDIVRVPEPVPSRSRMSLAIAALLLLGLTVGIAALAFEADESVHLEVADMSWGANGLVVQSHSGALREVEKSGVLTLRTGEDVTVPLGSSVELGVVDGSSVRVYGGSRFKLTVDGDLPEFELRYGRAKFSVEKTAETSDGLVRPTFLVTTPAVVAGVIGTQFDVTHDRDRRSSRVTVSEGQVRITHRRSRLAPLVLSAGESAKAFKASRMQYTLDRDAQHWEWKRKQNRQWVMEVESAEVIADESKTDESASEFFGKENPDKGTEERQGSTRTGSSTTKRNTPLDLPADDPRSPESEEDH